MRRPCAGEFQEDRRRLLLIWAPLSAVVAAVCAACLVFNAPPSPLRSQLVPVADAVFGPWYSQSWRLSGPRAAEGRRSLLLSVRYADDGRTRSWELVRRTAPVGAARLFRQGKDARMLDCFGEQAFGPLVGSPGADTSARMLRTRCRDDFVTPSQRGVAAAQWDRYFSAHARELAGAGRRIEAVRMRVRVTETVPYGQRGPDAAGRRGDTWTIYDSDWHPYVEVAAAARAAPAPPAAAAPAARPVTAR